MRKCCPSGHGCNAPGHDEACALDVLRAAPDECDEAALALARWQTFRRTRNHAERRYHRRGYERARDRALLALALVPH